MEWASADYVLLLSADDALTPGALARSTALLWTPIPTWGSPMEWRSCCTMTVRNWSWMISPRPATRVIPGHEFLQLLCAYGNFVATSTAVMRTSVQHRIGGYNPEFKHTSDLDMWMRTAAVGSIGFVDAAQGFYRWHKANMSAGYYHQPADDRLQVVDTCTNFMETHRHDIPQFESWFEDMRVRMGGDLLLYATKAFRGR